VSTYAISTVEQVPTKKVDSPRLREVGETGELSKVGAMRSPAVGTLAYKIALHMMQSGCELQSHPSQTVLRIKPKAGYDACLLQGRFSDSDRLRSHSSVYTHAYFGPEKTHPQPLGHS
jgi:hypothetical protein